MKKITDIPSQEFNQNTVLVRVDYNVPVVDGEVLDDARIRASFQTINFLLAHGASVLLVSHIENKQNPSLLPIAKHLESLYDSGDIAFKVEFHPNLDIALSQPKSKYAVQGTVHLFENLRTNAGEKDNDPEFSKQLAQLADIYINEAFPVCHRTHASVVGVPQFLPHAAGFTLIHELEQIEKGLHPAHPFIFILGGAKFETKLPLIEKFLHKAEKVIIGGALFNDILKAKGYEVGTSLVGDGAFDISHIISNPSLIIPHEVMVVDTETLNSASVAHTNSLVVAETVDVSQIKSNQSIVDVGMSLVDELEQFILNCQKDNKKVFVLWNGPMGLYEKGYTACTKGLAELFMKYQIDGLVGGGDTAAAIADSQISQEQKHNLYISTGGGAMIEYLMNETLPGIEALQ